MMEVSVAEEKLLELKLSLMKNYGTSLIQAFDIKGNASMLIVHWSMSGSFLTMCAQTCYPANHQEASLSHSLSLIPTDTEDIEAEELLDELLHECHPISLDAGVSFKSTWIHWIWCMMASYYSENYVGQRELWCFD